MKRLRWRTTHLLATIPYSKWDLPIQETNIHEIKELPPFNESAGVHSLTSYDKQDNVEYVIPYTFDYSLAKWETCRNRIFVNSCEVNEFFTHHRDEWEETINNSLKPRIISPTQYVVSKCNGVPDYSEAKRIDEINRKKYKSHNTMVTISHVLWFIPTFGFSCVSAGCESHKPDTYDRSGINRSDIDKSFYDNFFGY